MQRPTVAAITRDHTGGGIAVVADLLWRTVQARWGDHARLVTMFEHQAAPATFAEKARFTVSMTAAQLVGSTDWVLFSHLALAQVQSGLPSMRRCGYGVFLHGIEVWRPLSATETRLLADAQLRIANSHFTATRVMEQHPGIGTIDVCPLALASDTPPLRTDAASGIAIGPRAVLVVGRMAQAERYKGHDQMIDAWPSIVHDVPDARLIVVGGGDDVPRLKIKAAGSGAGDSILFTGFVSDATLQRLYQDAAVFALPSRGEGFGLVYLEAMRAGIPCVGSTHDAAAEVIADGVTGALVNQDDVPGLAQTISGLLLDPARRHAMGLAGQARVQQQFSFEGFSQRLLALLDRVGGAR